MSGTSRRALEWFVARRYLSSRRRGQFLSLITLISIGGVFLGVTALITVIAVMTGLQRDLQEKILGTNPHVYVFEQGEAFRIRDWPSVVERVRALPGVLAVEPFVMTQVGLTRGTDQYAQFGTLYGIDPSLSSRPLTLIEEQIRAGELSFGPTQSELAGILVGRRLADKMGLLPGDVVTVYSGENIRRGPLGDLVPKAAQFEVTGIFTTGMYEYDTANLYAPLTAVQDLLDMSPTEAGGVAVNIRDPWAAAQVRDSIQAALGSPYWTQDWTTLNHSLFSALKLEKLAMGLILFLIVLVAAFNIISTLVMVVTDKTREIGILKAMGLTRQSVLRIFMLQGLAIGFIGTAMGVVGGLALTWVLDRYELIKLPGDVYFLDTLPVQLDALDVGMIAFISILIAFAATIYPARQASRLLPVEAIRHE